METIYNTSIKIKEIFKTKLNGFVADSIIRVGCERMNINPENLDNSYLDEFIEKIKYSLLLFLSSTEAEKLIQQIKAIKEENNA